MRIVGPLSGGGCEQSDCHTNNYGGDGGLRTMLLQENDGDNSKKAKPNSGYLDGMGSAQDDDNDSYISR